MFEGFKRFEIETSDPGVKIVGRAPEETYQAFYDFFKKASR